jgi:hypothetical protein
MKVQFIFFTLAALLSAVMAHKFTCVPDTTPKCPAGQAWLEGDTPQCDTRICRGARPVCEDPPELVFKCRCTDPNEKMDGDKCVKQCPLYP